MSCVKAQGVLARKKTQVLETVDAKKVRLGPKDALALAKLAKKITVARGQKIVTLVVADTPDTVLIKHLLGPSGNLRAPTARIKDQLYVGFNEEFYKTF